MPSKKKNHRSSPAASTPTTQIELETAKGLEKIALEELQERFARRIQSEPVVTPGSLKFAYSGNTGGLLSLATINAAYIVETFPIPRPKAFLGHQYKTTLVERINEAMALVGRDAYTTIHINAAGSDSSVMQRILQELGEAASLTPDMDDGDMVLRLRPAPGRQKGWDALIRLSPRPTATRPWRVVNVPGALNAAVASAMCRLSQPGPDDVVLNVAGGSGSIAIERALMADNSRIMLCDIDRDMLDAARANVNAAGLAERIEIYDWNALDIPMSPGSIDVMFADLPFGNHVGSHQSNVELYPALLKEAARVTRRDGRFVLITHEINLAEAVIRDNKKWEMQESIQISLSGLHPKIYVLLRS